MPKYINRHLDDEMMDNIDHALGRPENPMDETYRDHFEASASEAQSFVDSDYWDQTAPTFFKVNIYGRRALRSYLMRMGA